MDPVDFLNEERELFQHNDAKGQRNRERPCLTLVVRHRPTIMVIGVVLTGMILSGCHHMVPLVVGNPPHTAPAFAELKSWDTVRVTLQTGDSADFEIGEIQADALVAEDGRRFAYADIARLEVRRIAKVKTAAIIAMAPFVALILVGLTYHGE